LSWKTPAQKAQEKGKLMVRVTFMGTGAAFSTQRRTNVAILVQEGNTELLLECGPTILFQLDQAGSAVDRIRYLFVSHRHGDHLLGLPMFLVMRSLGGLSGALTILGSKDVVQAGKDLTSIVYPELTERLGNLSWVEMPSDEAATVKVGQSIKLSTLPVPHGPRVSTLAARLDFQASGRSLVYTGDMAYVEELATLATGCDLLVHETNYCEALEPAVNPRGHGGHSTARQAGRTASRANCRILALVHLSPEYAGREDAVRAEAAEEFGGEIIVPNDGATVYL
jgi:ribonuclease Z